VILVVGGTSEAPEICGALLKAGFKVTLTTLTDIEMEGVSDLNVSRRTGPLDVKGFMDLIRSQGVSSVVDVSHPYALNVKKNADEAAKLCGIPYFSWVRPATDLKGLAFIPAIDHEHAAIEAFAIGKPVLTTIGVRNLKVYIERSKAACIPVFCRVLPHEESLRRCAELGIEERNVIALKGPFSIEENIEQIKSNNIGVLVTKDGGNAGGVVEKLAAAEKTGCTAIVVNRPENPNMQAGKSLKVFMDEVILSLGAGPKRL
jgi:precorrin-6A/cobalt-precorrin-6A reductase